MEVELYLLAEILECDLVDSFLGQALRDDDGQRESLVFDASEKGPPIPHDVAVGERLSVAALEVGCEELANFVVLDGECVCLVCQLNGKGVGNFRRVDVNVFNLFPEVDEL